MGLKKGTGDSKMREKGKGRSQREQIRGKYNAYIFVGDSKLV